MRDLPTHGFSLIPGPPEIPEPFFSTELEGFTEYPVGEVAEAFDELFTPLPIADLSDWSTYSWEWREGERFAVIGFGSMLSEEGLDVWWGSELTLSCTPEDLLALWTRVRARFGTVWLHDGDSRLYRPETFLETWTRARGNTHS